MNDVVMNRDSFRDLRDLRVRTRPRPETAAVVSPTYGTIERFADATPFLQWLRNLTNTDAFPGPLPVSVERAHFAKMKSSPDRWSLGWKHDGARCLLCFGTMHGMKMCFLVDRRMRDVICFRMTRAPKVLFQDTIFDGELLHGAAPGRRQFVVFDALVVSGVTVGAVPKLSQRLDAARRGLRDYVHDPADFAAVSVKDFVEGDVFAASGLPPTDHPQDGVVIVRNDRSVSYGRDYNTFKLKPPGSHTVDFEVAPDLRGLCVYDPQKRRAIRVAEFANDRDHLGRMHAARSVVEIAIDAQGRPAGPAVRRYDKTRSNDVLTYERTKVNVAENISVDDLRAVFKNRD